MPLLVILVFLSQDYSQRGFVQSQATIYPQEAANDSGHAVGEIQVHYESFYKPWSSVQFAGALDIRSDTHHQTERDWRFDWKDRERQRPQLSLHRLSVQYHRGGFTIEAGKQFVRWGRTDIVNPTDRFAPRDFLTVVDNDFLGVGAVRATYERGSNTVDVVWSPRLTPSRTPLFSQRWFISPPGTPAFAVERSIPPGSQSGIRWSHTGDVEFAAAFYSGFNHLPSYEPVPGTFVVRETYAEQRMIGGDLGIPLRFLAIKGEAAYFHSPDHRSDNYVLYVVQLERQAGEWFFIGGYGGEAVTERRPDRGLRSGPGDDANNSGASRLHDRCESQPCL